MFLDLYDPELFSKLLQMLLCHLCIPLDLVLEGHSQFVLSSLYSLLQRMSSKAKGFQTVTHHVGIEGDSRIPGGPPP